MKQININDVEDIINDENGYHKNFHSLNPDGYYWVCSTCMNFETEFCPFKDVVTYLSSPYDVNCDKFFD